MYAVELQCSHECRFDRFHTCIHLWTVWTNCTDKRTTVTVLQLAADHTD